MRVLLDAGANPGSRLHNRDTPLLLAASKGHVGAMRELARTNANPLLATGKIGGNIHPLEAAAQHGHVDVVSELIQMFGIRRCAGKSRGVWVLRSAAYGNHPDVILKLTDAGVLNTGDRVDHRCPVCSLLCRSSCRCSTDRSGMSVVMRS